MTNLFSKSTINPGMRLTQIVLVTVLSFSIHFSLSAQKIRAGINGGLTYNQTNAIDILDGDEVDKIFGYYQGLPGFHASVFGDLHLSPRLLLRLEAGYELLRFRYDTYRMTIGEIDHWRGGLLFGIKPLKWWTLTGGIEVVNRNNDVTGKYPSPGLNGSHVEGVYEQGIIGTYAELKNRYQIGLRMTVPRIASVTRENWRIASTNTYKISETRLRAFQLSFGMLILKKRSIHMP